MLQHEYLEPKYIVEQTEEAIRQRDNQKISMENIYYEGKKINNQKKDARNLIIKAITETHKELQIKKLEEGKDTKDLIYTYILKNGYYSLDHQTQRFIVEIFDEVYEIYEKLTKQQTSEQYRGEEL